MKKNSVDFPYYFPPSILSRLSQVLLLFVEDRDDAVLVFVESSLVAVDAAARSSGPSTRRRRCQLIDVAAVAVDVSANAATLFSSAIAPALRLFSPRDRHGESLSRRWLRRQGCDRSLVPGCEVRV